LSKDAEPFSPASVTLGSPSDNTTPRCRLAARGQVLPLPNPQFAALGTAWSVQTASLHSLTRKPQYRHDGACREGRAGRSAEVASVPTATFGPHRVFRTPEKLPNFTRTYSLAPGSRRFADFP